MKDGLGGRPTYNVCVVAALVAHAFRETGTCEIIESPPPAQRGDAEKRCSDMKRRCVRGGDRGFPETVANVEGVTNSMARGG